MMNFINAIKSLVDLVSGFFNILTQFIPSWIVVLVTGFFGFLALIIAIKIIAKILDAIPIA